MYPWGDARPYHSYAAYCRRTFGRPIQKLPVDGGFTCPNRDGTVGHGGCSFCSNEAFTPAYCDPRRTVRQQVAAAELRDKGPADDLRLEVIEKRRVDVPLDLFPRQPAARLEAEDVVGLAARQGLFPDADGGVDADITLPHGELFLQRQCREAFALRPAVHHPFAFDFHLYDLISVGFCIYSSTVL